MTPEMEKLRKQIIERGAEALFVTATHQSDNDVIVPWKRQSEFTKQCYRDQFENAFDALRGIVRVTPCEATEEMLHAARNYFNEPMSAFEAIAAAGDLTRASEQWRAANQPGHTDLMVSPESIDAFIESDLTRGEK